MMPAPSEALEKQYRRAFVRNCMALIVRAYEGLDAHALRAAQEPHITGELVRSARALVESSDAERWMDDLEIHDDPPQSAEGVYGKNRPRIDIEFVQVRRGKRPRFHIEAKRLYRSDSVSEYLGEGGLQMFINGRYAAGWPSVGMIGYVQTDNCAIWLARIAAGLAAHRDELRIGQGQAPWESAGFVGDNVEPARISSHERVPSNLGRIEICHLLLQFL
jgi:hypothetical protein